MSVPLGLKDTRSLVWKVRKPLVETGAIESSVFVYGGNEWCLRLERRNIANGAYAVYLVHKNGDPSDKSFNITFYIGELEPYYFRKSMFNVITIGGYYPMEILYDDYLLKKDKHFGSRESLTFVVIFDEEVRVKSLPDEREKANPHSGLESLSEDLGSMLEEEDSNQDVELKCGSKTLKAHANILSGRSSVFRRMLSTDMVERRTGQIEIRDMEEDVLEAFVRHLYTGKLPELTQESAKSLYRAADKYDVPVLAKLCAQFLIQNLTVEYACDTLLLADAHGDQGFRNDVIDYVLDKKIPLMTDQWSVVMENHPKLAAEVLNKAYRSQNRTVQK